MGIINLNDKYKTLEDIIFKLKFTKKGLQRDIKKSETKMGSEINNIKNDIWKSDIMAAQIHSEMRYDIKTNV